MEAENINEGQYIKPTREWTPCTLHREGEWGKSHAFQIEHGAEVTARTKDGSTSLHLAFREGHVSVARIPLHSGADPVAHDNMNRTPHDVSSERGYRSLSD